MVDFPAPLFPTIATIWFGLILKFRLSNNSFELYLNFTFLNSIHPLISEISFVPYFSSFCSANCFVLSEYGWIVFNNTTNGFFKAFSWLIVSSSAGSYCFASISPKDPSHVTTTPIVEWSVITFFVPIAAAFVNGIS